MKNNMNTKTMNTGMNTNNAIETKEEITMKTNKTNKTRRMNKVFAGALAAIMMMTSMASLGASAAVNTDAVVHMNTNAAIAANADFGTELSDEELEEMLGKMSLEEILNVWANIDTTAAAAKKGTVVEPEKTEEKDKTADELKEMAVKYGKKLFKLGVEKLVDTAPAPINSMLKSPVGSMVDMALGENKPETSNDDVIAAIEAQAKVIQDQLKEMEKNIIQNNKDTASSTSYGGVMDDFTSAAKACRIEIQNYLNDTKLTPNERAVKTANLLEKKNIISLMDRVTLVMTDKPDTDQDNRNMFQVGYDLYKKDSLFTGEALDKSQAYVLKRVNTYMQNCLVVLELLKAQERVTQLTPEEVAELGTTYRTMYDKMECSQYDAKKAVTNLLSQLIKSDEANKEAKKDNREGIINKTKDYFSQDRFVYINRGKEYVPVNQKLFANTCAAFMNIEIHTNFGNWLAKMNTDLLNKCKVLTETDIRYIAEQAKAEKKTITKYLEDIGFDTGSKFYRGKAPLLYDGNYVDQRFRSEDGWIGCWALYTSKQAKVYGYRMDLTNDYARKDRPLIDCWRCTFDGTSEDDCMTEPIMEKLSLYLVAFVGRDFVDPYALG